jgi:MSHA pilin protein MshD
MTRQKGFTLIESIIAIVLLGIAIGTLLKVQEHLLRASLLPENMNRAAAYAEQRLEMISATRFSQIQTWDWVTDGDYRYRMDVGPVPAPNDLGIAANDANYKQVVINVQVAGQTATLTTLAANKNG